jgi:hypothetical protein
MLSCHTSSRERATGIDDTPSFKHYDRLARGLGQLLRVNSFLMRVGLGSKKLAGLKREVEEVRARMHELADYNERFNRCFSKEGWLAFGSFSFEVLKQAVDECEAGRLGDATERLMRHFGPESVGDQLSRLNGVGELRVRRRLIDLAFTDYEAGRYHAVIPVLLMVIDGAVNDAVGVGFHADGVDLSAWDSLTAADGAIYDIKSIFQRGRRTTRTEAISVPYRNGILHGMDLGYDNETVAAKCWCFLFVVADWIKDKKSEAVRQERFAEETRIPSLRELFGQISDNERMKQANEEWSPRRFLPEDVRAMGHERPADPGTPEEVVLRFLDLWAQRNYGGMAKLYWAHARPESPRLAGDVRALLGDVSIEAYRLERIDDEGSGVSQVTALVNPESDRPRRYVARMIFESDSGEVLPRSLPGGTWRVVWVQESESQS